MKLYHVDFEADRIKQGLCPHLPAGYLTCHDRHCSTCEIADRIRATKAREHCDKPLFDKENCLRQNARDGGDIFFRRLVVLSEDVMKRLCIEKSLYYQIAYAYDGAGCLPKNKAGPVDIYLVADEKMRYTVYRYELLGIPNEDALRYYEKIFFMGIHKR